MSGQSSVLRAMPTFEQPPIFRLKYRSGTSHRHTRMHHDETSYRIHPADLRIVASDPIARDSGDIDLPYREECF